MLKKLLKKWFRKLFDDVVLDLLELLEKEKSNNE